MWQNLNQTPVSGLTQRALVYLIRASSLYAQVAQLGKASVLQSTALCAAERRQSSIVVRNEQRTQVVDLATRRAGCDKNKVQYAQVAQSVEQRTENTPNYLIYIEKI